MCLEKLPDGSRLHTHTHTPLERDKKTTEKNFFSLTHRTERAAAGTVPAFLSSLARLPWQRTCATSHEEIRREKIFDFSSFLTSSSGKLFFFYDGVSLNFYWTPKRQTEGGGVDTQDLGRLALFFAVRALALISHILAMAYDWKLR
jgi:hypothetical protein